jgi:flagellar basal-body rod modification protein FlgD
MTTTAITATQPTTTGTPVLSTKPATGDNTFLQLLTAQLQNQTPLEPVDNASFMQQMASYSSMEEQRNLNGNMLKLLDYQGLLARIQSLSEGSALLGKDVTFTDENGAQATAKVESVFVAETGDVRLKLAGGQEIDMRSVTGIAETAAVA